MARTAEGWKLRTDPRTGIVYVRFRHQKIRYSISTGERDPGPAAKKAAIIYAEVISGRWQRQLVIARPGQPLEEIAAEWLADIEGECRKNTWKLYVIHVGTHFAPFFGSLDRVTESGSVDYSRARLKKVLRVTLVKELTTLRRFMT